MPETSVTLFGAYTVIEEIVEGFVEGFFTCNFYTDPSQYARIVNRPTGGLPITETTHNLLDLTRNIVMIS